MYKCFWCDGKGEVGESPDGAQWFAVPCQECNGTGKSDKRYVRQPWHDKRIARGDDFAGDAWLDLATRKVVHGAVGYDRNA